MIVNRSSWHYRYLRMWGTNPPRTLCSYFWVLVIHCTVLPLMLALLSPAVLSVFVYDELRKLLSRRGPACLEKKPNLFVEWVKAKKRKVCPLIEYEG